MKYSRPPGFSGPMLKPCPFEHKRLIASLLVSFVPINRGGSRVSSQERCASPSICIHIFTCKISTPLVAERATLKEGACYARLIEGSDVRARWAPADKLVVAAPEEDSDKAWNQLMSRDIQQMPVVSMGRLAGLFRRGDITRWLHLQSDVRSVVC